MKVSIVIPLHNEAVNVERLYRELKEFAVTERRITEMIFVDDGSTDGTYERLVEVAAGDFRVKALRLRRNFGQTAALCAGFDLATGDVICPMDGDLQNDPHDIPKLLQKIEELTLYVIDLKKENDSLKEQLAVVLKRLNNYPNR